MSLLIFNYCFGEGQVILKSINHNNVNLRKHVLGAHYEPDRIPCTFKLIMKEISYLPEVCKNAMLYLVKNTLPGG